MLIETQNTQDELPAIRQLPLLFLWMNTGCNAHCGMCTIWRDTSCTRLSTEEIDAWIPALNDLNVTEIQLCGESTTHPKLPAICQSLDDAGIDIHLLTNGLRLEKVAGEIKDNLTSVTVSLDGPPEIHDRVRAVKDAYSRLEKGIRILRGYLPSLLIEGRCVVHGLNYHALGATVDAAHELGLSSISFLGIDASNDAFGRDRVADDIEKVPQDFLFRRSEIPLLKYELDRLEKTHSNDFASGYIVESRATLENILVGYYAAMIGDGVYRPREYFCNAPWKSAVIEPDGQVRPCFFLPSYGSLHEAESLNTLINSHLSRSFRSKLASEGHPICRQCICPRYIENESETGFVGIKLR